MPITFFHTPDEVIFHGDTALAKGCTFFECRLLTDDSEKLNRLYNRLKSYYVDALIDINHPFLSSILVCIGLEVIGQVFLGSNEQGNTIEGNTILAYQMLDPILRESLSESYKSNYNRNRNQAGLNIDFSSGLHTYANVFRKGLRNTFSHNYRSLGVLLDFQPENFITLHEADGIMIVNPKILKEKFINLFDELFNKAISLTHDNYRANALRYWNILIM